MSDDAALAYLAEVLALDPADQSGRIMELRAARRGAASAARPGADDADARAEARAAARDAIDALREDFWTLEADEVETRLAALDLSEFPDLERTRARLLDVNDARDEADEIARDRAADRALKAVLRRVLIASGPEAAHLRDRAARDAARPDRARQAKSFVKLLRSRYPGLAALEADWLARLTRARKDKKDSAAIKGGLGCIGTYLVISFGIRLVRWIVEWFQGG